MLNFFSHTYSSNFSFFSSQQEVHSPSLSEPNTLNDQPTRTSLFGGSKILKAVTSNILETFKTCNPQFFYNPVNNPRRCLTHPPEAIYNDGYDNIFNEYIIYLNEIIRSPENHEYQVLELLGKGTFGQVVRCQRKDTKEEFALKIIRNKPGYTTQALSEIKVYKKLKEENPHNEDYLIKIYDYFVFRNHICLIFEILNVNLLDLLKMSYYTGFTLRFVSRLSKQILEGLSCLEKNKIIHCDLKPENVLLTDNQSDNIKIIDLGSSCFTHGTIYTYIQSRHYRAPEVLLGLKYTQKIDSWSLGCMAAEFYLGLPLFPGSDAYDQIKRIIDILGMPKARIIEKGIFKNKYFKKNQENNFVFKSPEEFEKEQNIQLEPHKKFFVLNKLEDLEMYYNKSKQRERQPQERQNFNCFLHFLKGLLEYDPVKRWSSSQALLHPFITKQEFIDTWEPPKSEDSLQLFENTMINKEAISQPIKSSFLGFVDTNLTTPKIYGESYRPFVQGSQPENKEAINQSKNVYLLNSQAKSSKLKNKLSLNSSSFNISDSQISTLNSDPAPIQNFFISNSEPNTPKTFKKSNFSNKTHKKKHGNNSEFALSKKQFSEKSTLEEEQEENKGHLGPQLKSYNSNDQSYYPQNQTQTYSANAQRHQRMRYRSNSDQGADDTIFFHKKAQNYHQHNRFQNQQFRNKNKHTVSNDIPTLQTPDTAETSFSSNDFELKNKFAHTVNKISSKENLN